MDRASTELEYSAGNCPAGGERGAVIMIVALIAVALFAFIALAIDSSMLATSKAQQRYTAEKMALGALRAFVGAGTAATDSDKLAAALARAQELANEQGNILLTDPFLVNPGVSKELGTGITGTPNDGYVIPGKWYFRSEGVDCSTAPNPCPCKSGAAATPCFQPYTSIANFTTYGQPNGFQVKLHLRSDSPIRTSFGSVVHGDYLFINSEATAALVPTRGVFAVDLSRSMAFDTHVPYEASNKNIVDWVGEAAYQVVGAACPAPGTCTADDGCHFVGGNPDGMFDEVWNYPTFSRDRKNRPSATNSNSDPTVAGYALKQYNAHFRDDYQCYLVTYQDGSNAPVTQPYMVDTYHCKNTDDPKACADPSYDPASGGGLLGGMDGAEPLTSALYGVREALDYFEKRGVPGTKIGLLGFDQTSYIDVRRINPVEPGDANYDLMKDITEVNSQTAATLQKRYGDHMFFPRHDRPTNIPQMLERAAFMLQDANDDGIVNAADGMVSAGPSNAENFIAVISDGMTNCNVRGVCDESDAGLANSINAAETFATTNLMPQKIKVHFLMLGRANRPHTLLRKSGKNPKSCMDETEARETNPPADYVDEISGSASTFTALRSLYKANPASFVYTPNRLYKLVEMTDGLWFPIRPPCVTGDIAACNSGALMDDLNNQCAGASDKVASYSTYTDASGRLICDPYCNSIREQIKGAVEQIAGRSPYVLVN